MLEHRKRATTPWRGNTRQPGAEREGVPAASHLLDDASGIAFKGAPGMAILPVR
jgi:hypothetical protein